jgi:hypothetical protein
MTRRVNNASPYANTDCDTSADRRSHRMGLKIPRQFTDGEVVQTDNTYKAPTSNVTVTWCRKRL